MVSQPTNVSMASPRLKMKVEGLLDGAGGVLDVLHRIGALEQLAENGRSRFMPVTPGRL